ncbi:hypothetical protein [Pseudoalteromonas arctica]|uniref:DUF91 domain-containing protein n=1 Tax=Pseudoalteromonas arctica TaxID=394751 RepID=A0A7Y0DTP6_9GAMM|nr:hypothetical protein [Pseudoalteromonas arctica]NMM41477.1 hypothetical protein [Pseudoalteromonas arctica]
MLFKIISKDNKQVLEAVNSQSMGELQLEQLIIENQRDENNNITTQLLNEGIFGEELILLKNQVKVANGKRLDVLALDKNGNGVVIELKKDLVCLGVDTQALQYLADISRFHGDDLIKNKKLVNKGYVEAVESFIDSAEIDRAKINTKNRIILIANKFDRTLFSMGEWLSDKGVGFKCIQYSVSNHEDGTQYIDFSVVFDRSPESTFPLSFSAMQREPKYFWYNIGTTETKNWACLKEKSIISAGFDGSEHDKGDRLLNSFIPGDILIAYANGYGAIGVAEISQLSGSGYTLLSESQPNDPVSQYHLHRLKVKWLYTSADDFSGGIPPSEVKSQFEIHHPYTTSCSISAHKAKRLVKGLKDRLSCFD